MEGLEMEEIKEKNKIEKKNEIKKKKISLTYK